MSIKCLSNQIVLNNKYLNTSQIYDNDRGVRTLPPLREGDAVRIRSGATWERAVVIGEYSSLISGDQRKRADVPMKSARPAEDE